SRGRAYASGCVLSSRWVMCLGVSSLWVVIFFDVTATTAICTLSLHDALPICCGRPGRAPERFLPLDITSLLLHVIFKGKKRSGRSEERFSRNAETDLVCRLLLEKKQNPCPPRR